MTKWQPRTGARIAIGVVGLLVIAVGLLAWELETEYGGNAVGGAAAAEDGLIAVFDVDEQATEPEGDAATSIVFVGTEEEAQAYMDQRWREGRNYVVEAAIIAVGVLLVVAAVIPTRLLRSPTGTG